MSKEALIFVILIAIVGYVFYKLIGQHLNKASEVVSDAGGYLVDKTKSAVSNIEDFVDVASEYIASNTWIQSLFAENADFNDYRQKYIDAQMELKRKLDKQEISKPLYVELLTRLQQQANAAKAKYGWQSL